MSDHGDDEWREFLRWKAQQQPSRDPGVHGTSARHAQEGPFPIEFAQPMQIPTDEPQVAEEVVLAITTAKQRHGSRRPNPWLVAIVGFVVLGLLAVGTWYGVRAAGDTQAVASVERGIAGIGLVTINSADQIKRVGADYLALSPDLQGQVSNFDVLERATEDLDARLTEVISAQEAIDIAQTTTDCSLTYGAEEKYNGLDESQKARIAGGSAALQSAAKCREAAIVAEESRKHSLIRLEEKGWYGDYYNPKRGCDVWIAPNFTNISKKTMNYVWLRVTVENKVGDLEPDKKGRKEHSLRIIGPIKAGKTYKDSNHHFTLHYACVWKQFSIEDVTIQYSNGDRETIDDDYFQVTKGWKSGE